MLPGVAGAAEAEAAGAVEHMKVVEVGADMELPALEPSAVPALVAFQPGTSSPRRRTSSACTPASPPRGTRCCG